MTNVFVPYRNPVTGLAHHAQPGITKIPSPESLLFVGNSLFFFNNGVHRFVRKLLAGSDPRVSCRMNLIAIGGASLYWHDLETYFRPNAIASYAIKNDGTNRLVWRAPQKKLWDAVILCDSTQGPIHPDLRDRFIETAARDAAIARSHGTPEAHGRVPVPRRLRCHESALRRERLLTRFRASERRNARYAFRNG